LGGYDNAFFSRRKECMHASLRLFAALSVVTLWFLTTDSLLGESPQQQDRSGLLTNLKSLHVIVEEVNADARKAGITESDLEEQTLAALKRNIPTLTIREGGPFIGITVIVLENKTVGGQSLGYAAFVHVDVTRPVMILSDDGNSIPISHPAKVWDKGTLVTGTRNDIAGQVKDVLDLFLIQFSVDYYKQN
jgi:hypothetical protein